LQLLLTFGIFILTATNYGRQNVMLVSMIAIWHYWILRLMSLLF